MEQAIQEALKNKDFNRAFSLIVEFYDRKLYWHIRRMLGAHEDAADVLQESFIKVWKSLPKFRGDASVYTWLYRIATNESLSFLRKRAKQYSSVEGDKDAIAKLTADVYFDEAAANAKFEIAIANLPSKQRAVFNLKYFEEMKYEEMAEVLNTSVGALKASYHHAVQKIKATLKEH